MFALFHHDERDHQQAEDSLLVVAHSSDFGFEEHDFHEEYLY